VSNFGGNKKNAQLLIGTSGKVLLRHMLAERSSLMPSEMAERLQLYAFSSKPSRDVLSSSSTSPSPELESLCAEAISALPEEVEAMRKGSKNVVNKLVGRVMRSSRGRADASAIKVLLEKMIIG
jgi:aspartyl-tRNA(Asn)/glutamyl-tRNA(Gln) amidotransferase subunit B